MSITTIQNKITVATTNAILKLILKVKMEEGRLTKQQTEVS